mmetsp:Transcript_29593/g.95413  ORF Transcript_29593/g.95413 Transcript_29593/m.95413 type:complete len:223 (+) Transcript_29593:416-1084(+)
MYLGDDDPGLQDSCADVPRLRLHPLEPLFAGGEAGRHADDHRRPRHRRLLLPLKPRPARRNPRETATTPASLRPPARDLHRPPVPPPPRRPHSDDTPLRALRRRLGWRFERGGKNHRPRRTLRALRRQYGRLPPLRRRPGQHLRHELPGSAPHAVPQRTQAPRQPPLRLLRCPLPHGLRPRSVAHARPPARRSPDNKLPIRPPGDPRRRYRHRLAPLLHLTD